MLNTYRNGLYRNRTTNTILQPHLDNRYGRCPSLYAKPLLPSTPYSQPGVKNPTNLLPGNASITAEDSTITDVGSFYIVATGSSFRSAGFISSNETVPTNASTVGFKTYGSQVVFVDAGVYESKFWATTTDIPGVWSLAWNVLGASQTNSTPVTIKRISI